MTDTTLIVCESVAAITTHGEHCACIVCMCFHDWLDARKEWRRQYKREWRETPVEERFDLGGESG